MSDLHDITTAANNLFAFNLQKDGIFLNKRLTPAKKSKLIDHIVSLQTHLLIHKGVPRREPHGIIGEVFDHHGNHLEITLVLTSKKSWRLDVCLNGNDFILQDLDRHDPHVVLFTQVYGHLQQTMYNPHRRELTVPMGFYSHQPEHLNGTLDTTMTNVNPWEQYRSQEETSIATTTMADSDTFQRWGMKSAVDMSRRPEPGFYPTNTPSPFSNMPHNNFPIDIIYADSGKDPGSPPAIIGKSNKGFHIAIKVKGENTERVNQVLETAKKQWNIDVVLHNLATAMGVAPYADTDEFKDIYQLPQKAFIGMQLYSVNVG